MCELILPDIWYFQFILISFAIDVEPDSFLKPKSGFPGVA